VVFSNGSFDGGVDWGIHSLCMSVGMQVMVGLFAVQTAVICEVLLMLL
jgi:hypothetical protein